MKAIISASYFVNEIMQKLMQYPPSMIDPQTNEVLIFPYTLDSIVSKCVKIASNITMNEHADFEREVRFHLHPFDVETTNLMLGDIAHFIRHLVAEFTKYNWYDDLGESPWRFQGFVGNNDIQLGRP